MRTKIIALVLSVLLAMPFTLSAEETEITLFEVAGAGFIPGDDPLDGPGQIGINPVEPTSFRASLSGRTLSITIEEPAITSAQAIVVNNATGSTVVNRSFSSALLEQLNAGSYSLEIQTDGGTLIGSFDVE